VTSSMLSRLLPFLISLVFWRKKPRQSLSVPSDEASSKIEQAVNESEASRSREILKVLTLEREIIGTSLTTIYESEVQGIITREERDRLVDKYSADLKQLESRISEHQRVVDMFDLESAKKELLQSFREKMSEIERKLVDLRSGAAAPALPATEVRSSQSVTPPETTDSGADSAGSTKPTELQDAKTKTEKKIEAIREEVLKAMERLEQIESEG